MDTERELRQLARELLTGGQVGIVIGYGAGTHEERVRPLFVTDPAAADGLVWNRHCYHNLTRFLRKPEVRAKGRPAIVLKGCDVRSLIGLIAENQVKREDVTVIGVACDGVQVASRAGEPARFLSKCVGCEVMTPALHDRLLGNPAELKPATGPSLDEEIARLDALSPAERRAFWAAEFARCLKCYACREVCPHCFCTRCIVEKSMPQWISTASTEAGNFGWNVIRAFHLVGRCVDCQECARACPVGIRLDLLNRKMIREVETTYGFRAGTDPQAGPPLTTYKQDDYGDFIR